MKFFIDTAKVEDIKKANDMGVICGVTTNPSLIAKEGRVFEEVIAEIASIVDGPISGEVKATTVDAEGMIEEGRAIAKIHPNMVVKIPMTVEGLKAVKVLTAEGIKTNVTLVFSANQALLAADASSTLSSASFTAATRRSSNISTSSGSTTSSSSFTFTSFLDPDTVTSTAPPPAVAVNSFVSISFACSSI